VELLDISYEKVNRIMCVPARPVEMREAGGSVERGLQRRQLNKDDIPVINPLANGR